MKWEVKLYQGGSVFTEEVYANDYQDAKATAQARNPTVKIIGCNPVFDKHDPFEIHSSSTSSSSSSSSSGSNMSLGDMGGSAVILGILFAIGAIVAYWYIVIPVAIIIGIIWYYINNN